MLREFALPFLIALGIVLAVFLYQRVSHEEPTANESNDDSAPLLRADKATDSSPDSDPCPTVLADAGLVDGESEELPHSDWKSKLISPSQLVAENHHQIDRDTPLVNKYEDLVDDALAGDPIAAIELAGSLSHCLQAPRNSKQLDQLINETNQTRQVEGNLYQVSDLDVATKEIVRQFEYCKGISKDQVLDHFLYMKIAADSGNLQAKVDLLNYGSMSMEDRKSAYLRVWSSEKEMLDDELQYLIDAAEAGNVNAIYRLGGRLMDGSGHLSSVDAAAYRIAGGQMRAIAGLGDPGMISRAMDRTMNSLTPSDAEAAIEKANELIGRDDCCSYLKKGNN